MTLNDIRLDLKYYGVNPSDAEEIINACKKRGFSPEILDEELELRGYDKLFTIEYDDYVDDYDDYEEENFEKIPRKTYWED